MKGGEWIQIGVRVMHYKGMGCRERKRERERWKEREGAR